MERDLIVLLTRTGSGEVDADDRWPLLSTLVNRGKATHWIVRPNDGSDVGWREPHTYYTAEMETTPGVWRPVPDAEQVGRCGNYATDWYRDVTEMAPGASIALDDFRDPGMLLDFRRSVTIRLYAHYDYEGGRKRSRSFLSAREPMELPKELEGVGPFSLVSAPLELRVLVDASAELSLVLRRRQVRVGERLTVATLGDASVVSRVGAPLDLGEDFSDSRFHLEVKDVGETFSQPLDGPHLLGPGERVTLSALAEARDFLLEAPGIMRVRLRYDAALTRDGQLALRRYRSPWVDVQVVR